MKGFLWLPDGGSDNLHGYAQAVGQKGSEAGDLLEMTVGLLSCAPGLSSLGNWSMEGGITVCVHQFFISMYDWKVGDACA